MPIASGGMATVYLARARGAMGFETEVAVKLTHPHLRESAEFSAGLLEEAKLAARIRHRNVAAVLDADVDPLGVYLVMEYVEGDTLHGLLKASPPLPKRMGMRLLIDALAGLQAAHELRDDDGHSLRVVHRDFTPHNILVGTDGVARLTDFGIAKATTRLGHTRTGFIKGKIGYMAPEQACGEKLDERTDVWAAGVIAWEMLSGQRLYPSEDDMATLLKVATSTPPRLRTVDPSIPVEMEEAVASALQRNPEARCPSAFAFARALAAASRAHDGVAETQEVSEWIRFRLGPKLAVQREDLARAKELRGSSDVSVPVSRREPTPASQEKTSAETPAAGSATVREVPATPVATARIAEATPPAAIEDPTRTDTSSVVSQAPRITSSRSRVMGIGLAVGLAGLATFAILASHRSPPSAPSPTAIVPTFAPAIAPAPAASPSSAPASVVTATPSSGWSPSPVPIDALPLAPTASATASAAPPTRPHHGRPASTPHPRPPDGEGPTPLAPSPYNP
jgi:serine/threonine-protein kinase